eukprot:288160-Chlamydomonas_euryale.AAC.3
MPRSSGSGCSLEAPLYSTSHVLHSVRAWQTCSDLTACVKGRGGGSCCVSCPRKPSHVTMAGRLRVSACWLTRHPARITQLVPT